MKLTKKQKTLLHIAKNKLELTEEQYRAALVQIGGVTSSTELDQEAEYTRGKTDENALNKWLLGTWKVSSLRFLRKETAQKVITALKSMKARAA